MALPEFNLEQRGGTKIWISSGFADPAFVDALAEADRFFDNPECQIVKDQKKVKVGRLTLRIAGKQRSIYIKKYNAFSLRFRLVSPLVQSGALRSLRGAKVLHEGTIATAKPVAAVESRFCGMLRNSFFISEEIAGGKTADAYWIENLQEYKNRGACKQQRAFLRQLAALFHSLHARRIYHNDLKDANILVVNNRRDESIEFFLLDLEGVRQCGRLSERRRIKNLVQLYRTLGRYVPRSQQAFFLKCYLGPAFEDGKLKRKVIEAVLSSARNVDIAKARVIGGN
ncbi:MAG: lipopolysaccharide kinase InaA family protein [Candidatus Binatia bacterium]